MHGPDATRARACARFPRLEGAGAHEIAPARPRTAIVCAHKREHIATRHRPAHLVLHAGAGGVCVQHAHGTHTRITHEQCARVCTRRHPGQPALNAARARGHIDAPTRAPVLDTTRARCATLLGRANRNRPAADTCTRAQVRARGLSSACTRPPPDMEGRHALPLRHIRAPAHGRVEAATPAARPVGPGADSPRRLGHAAAAVAPESAAQASNTAHGERTL